MKKVFVGLIFLVLLLWGFRVWGDRQVKGWGVETVAPKWLPVGATEVTFIEVGSRRVAEFKISYDEVSDWCRSTGMGLGQLGVDEEVTIQRPNVVLAEFGKTEMPSLPKSPVSEKELSFYNNWREVKLTQYDYFYSSKKPSQRGYALGYDVGARKCYYEDNRR